jgi:AAA+ superfamily predicted ATPase
LRYTRQYDACILIYRSPWSFESELKRLLQYATLWKAVVLLDEADVFLEAREDDSSNIQRNALVAVFLKELEYFSGIVFLTTNRLASFDHAMKSRIHLALSYDAPGRDLRRQLWRQALSNVPSEEMSSSDDLDEVATNLASRPLNGREIYNTLNTARTIARFKKIKLQLGHIESVLNVKSDFESRLQSVKKRMMRTGQHEMSLIGISRKNSILAAEPDAIEQ